jgi:glycosyltransferase involved in cell wall biosynthesis
MSKKPTISILAASKNQAKYIPDLINGLKSQSYQDFELIVIDSFSADNSKELFLSYDKIKLYEINCSANDAYLEAIKYVSGEYIMIATTSDFLYSPRWLEIAVDKLKSNTDISCVWASGVIVNEDSSIISLWADNYLIKHPPAMQHYLPFWLYMPYLPELNYVVNSNVFKYCIKNSECCSDEFNFLNKFLFNFTKFGFMQFYIPEIAHAGRTHSNSLTVKNFLWDRRQKYAFFFMRIKFIFDIYILRKSYKFRSSQLKVINKYYLDNFFIFLYKWIVIFIKNSFRKSLKHITKLMY